MNLRNLPRTTWRNAAFVGAAWGRGIAHHCRGVRRQSGRGRLARRLCLLGANLARQPDAHDDSPAHRRALGRDRRAGHRTRRRRCAAAGCSRHPALHRRPDPLPMAAPSGFDQARRAVVLSQHAVVHRPHRLGADRLVGAGAFSAPHRRPARTASGRAGPCLPCRRPLQRLDRLVSFARSAIYVVVVSAPASPSRHWSERWH